MRMSFDLETTGLYPWEGATITHLSIALASGNCYVYGANEIHEGIELLVVSATECWAWNLQFDLSFIYHYYPDAYRAILRKSFDTMRLRAMVAPWDEKEGLGLKKTVADYLPSMASYEADLKLFCQQRGLKGDFREHLALMPVEMVNSYVAADSIATLKLTNMFIEKLKKHQVDYMQDHDLYRFSTDVLLKSASQGIPVDRKGITACADTANRTLEAQYASFREEHSVSISHVEDRLWEAEKAKRKTEKGKANVPRPVFNINSDTQLAMLFCGVLHQEAKILTPTGRPSFKAAHLGQFQGTDHLQNAGKTQLIANFCASMLNHTERDSRYHPQLKLTGTVTYRCAGSGGINIQALPRRHKEFMSCLGNEEGYEYVSVDCIAAEPSVISELTGDVNYKKIVFDLKNCAPYWEDGVLMLNDIYLSVLSTTPFGRTYLKHIWDTHIFPAGSFAEQWLIDSEVVKSVCKKYRAVAKCAVLSAGYGAGATRIHKAISEAGFEITPTEAANLHKGFWKLFSGVKQYAEDCAKECSEDNNCVRNRFGQIAWLSSSHKAFNYKVQSSINPIIQFFTRAILEEMPELAFITWIHDEAIFRLPFGSRFDFIKAHERATARTNNWLGFQRVTMGFGMAFGSNLYEAK